MSIAQLIAHFKQQGINIATLTRQQVIDAGYDGGEGISLVISCIKRQYLNEAKPKPRRKAKRSRKARKDTGRRKPRTASSAFEAQMTATLELVERVNGGEVEVEDNPLQLVDTSPGEQWPTFVVIHPDDNPDWLTANLPDTGYEQASPADNGLAPGVDW